MPGPVGHTFLSFMFEDAPPLSISIEARQEEGEGYDPLGSLFKQFELIYVVGRHGGFAAHQGIAALLKQVLSAAGSCPCSPRQPRRAGGLPIRRSNSAPMASTLTPIQAAFSPPNSWL